MEKKFLENMVSERCYNEIVEKVKYDVGEDAFEYIWPAVKKALIEGTGKVREQILISWLDCDTCRVCTECGKIMEEGWYNMGSYACSDECVMKHDGISQEEFDRYQIFKSTIENYLDDGQNIEDLTQEEIQKIIDENSDNWDAYYTEWC